VMLCVINNLETSNVKMSGGRRGFNQYVDIMKLDSLHVML
jgi:hypothetical protein